MTFAQIEIDLDRVGYFLGSGQRFFMAGKSGVHFGRTAEKKLVPFHFHPVGIGSILARIDAKQHILRFGVFLADIVRVAGGDQGQTHPIGHFDTRFHGRALNFQAIVLHFDKIPIAKQPLEPGGYFHGFGKLFLGCRAAASKQSSGKLS